MEVDMEQEIVKEQILSIMSVRYRDTLRRVTWDFSKLQEIRMRINRPLLLIYDKEEYFVTHSGKITRKQEEAIVVNPRELKETLEYISDYSLYAFEDEIRQGFITIQGGHRVGVAGKIILEHGRIKGMKYISFLNIRIAHQVPGCADKVMPYIMKNNQICHSLIVSPPRCGKTTLLRDIIRQLSNGCKGYDGVTVGVVDERSELGACHMGVPQNDLGIRTDVLDCCPKLDGMIMLIRSMAPDVIAVDEIGEKEDIEAIAYAMNCGCKMLATVHGKNMDELRGKPVFESLIREHVFERYIVLDSQGRIGHVQNIFDERGSVLYG